MQQLLRPVVGYLLTERLTGRFLAIELRQRDWGGCVLQGLPRYCALALLNASRFAISRPATPWAVRNAELTPRGLVERMLGM